MGCQTPPPVLPHFASGFLAAASRTPASTYRFRPPQYARNTSFGTPHGPNIHRLPPQNGLENTFYRAVGWGDVGYRGGTGIGAGPHGGRPGNLKLDWPGFHYGPFLELPRCPQRICSLSKGILTDHCSVRPCPVGSYIY